MQNNEFVPLRLLEIVAGDVGKPRNDGTPGSALYSVPIKLSAVPPVGWAEIFVATWNSPPSYTSMHQPGVCSIQEDRVILKETTVERIERTHATTLKLSLEAANREYPMILAKDRAQEVAREERERQHEQNVDEVARRIKFE